MKVTNLCGEDNKLLEPLVTRVLKKCEIHPVESVTIEDWDLDRVYLTIDGQEYTIRMWDIRESEKTVMIEWSLFLFKEGEDCGTRINGGNSYFRITKLIENNGLL